MIDTIVSLMQLLINVYLSILQVQVWWLQTRNMTCLRSIVHRRSWVPPAAWYHLTARFISDLRNDRWARSRVLGQRRVEDETFQLWHHWSFVHHRRRQCLTSLITYLMFLQVSHSALEEPHNRLF